MIGGCQPTTPFWLKNPKRCSGLGVGDGIGSSVNRSRIKHKHKPTTLLHFFGQYKATSRIIDFFIT